MGCTLSTPVTVAEAPPKPEPYTGAPAPANEADRLAHLKRLDILDSVRAARLWGARGPRGAARPPAAPASPRAAPCAPLTRP